jgi:hypothetical protein
VASDAASRRTIRVAEPDYQQLHRALVAVCEARASQTNSSDALHWARVAAQIRPFLALDSLVRADPEILRGLLALLGARASTRPTRRWRAVGLRLVATGATAWIVWRDEAMRQATIHGLLTGWTALRLGLARTGLQPSQLLALALLLSLAVRLIRRSSIR